SPSPGDTAKTGDLLAARAAAVIATDTMDVAGSVRDVTGGVFPERRRTPRRTAARHRQGVRPGQHRRGAPPPRKGTPHRQGRRHDLTGRRTAGRRAPVGELLEDA